MIQIFIATGNIYYKVEQFTCCDIIDRTVPIAPLLILYLNYGATLLFAQTANESCLVTITVELL